MNMKVYQNIRVTNESALPEGLDETLFNIKRAKIQKAYDKPSLSLELKEKGKAHYTYGYALIGHDLIDKFKRSMNVSKIESLAGKSVWGFLFKGDVVLKGLAVAKS